MMELDASSSRMSSCISLTVKTMDDCDFYLHNLESDTSVLTLKQLINSAKGIEEERQRLIYRGRVLEDHCTISHYSITDGNIVHLVARPENFRELRRENETQSDNGRNSTPGNNASTGQATTTTTGTSTANTTTAGTQNANNADVIEPIWQSLMSLHTLFSVSRDTLRPSSTTTTNSNVPTENNENEKEADEEQEGVKDEKDEKESPLSEESAASFASALSHHETTESTAAPSMWNDQIEYYVGQWLDVKDTVAQWLEATVMEVDNEQRRLYIHYNGWPVRWDEWIAFDSPRIAPFRAITRHASFNGQACPTPVTTVPNAPRSGPNDYRSLFPEMERVLRTVTPLIQEASGIVQRNVDDGNLYTSYDHNHTSLDNLPFETFRNEHHRNENINAAELNNQEAAMSNDESMRLMEISDQLCPILDRLGRVLTDFAPHLRQGSDAAYQRDYTRRLSEENEREQESTNAATTATADSNDGDVPGSVIISDTETHADGTLDAVAMVDDSTARNVARSIGTTYSMNNQFETSPSSETNPINTPDSSISNTSNRGMLSPYQISQRSFRTPITNARPTINTLGTTLTSLGTSGQMDIHLAILSPRLPRNSNNPAADALFSQTFNNIGALLSNNSVANNNNTSDNGTTTNSVGNSATPSLDSFANAFRSDRNGDSAVTDSPSYSSSGRSEDTTLQRLLNETARRERIAARNVARNDVSQRASRGTASHQDAEGSDDWRVAARTTTTQQTTTSSANEDDAPVSTGTSSSTSSSLSSSSQSSSGRSSGRSSIISSLARMFNMGGSRR